PSLFTDIDVPVDGSALGANALAVAGVRAQQTEGKLTVLHVVPGELDVAKAQEVVDAHVARVHVRDARGEVLLGRTADRLVEHADVSASVVVLSTHGRS